MPSFVLTKLKNNCLISIFAAIIIVILSQCRRERFTTDPSDLLSFSRDTILFDTVFSTVGSTTQYLKVYNTYNQNILISEIKLEAGNTSQYRFNVDGVDGPLVNNMVILPNDSIWVFVEVTVDPGAGNADFVIEDNLVFTTNGVQQKVLLNAWGRDAYFHGGLNDCGDPISEIISANTVWDDSKPHVIYGIVAVDSAVTLTINAGVEIYCHSKSGLYIYKGCLDINGEAGNEVTMQGDRLEPEYDNLPGQWGIQLDCPVETGIGPQIASIVRGGIWIYESDCSQIDYLVMRNGNVGIQVDTTGVDLAATGQYSCIIRNTKILNMAGTGLLGQGATIKGENLLIGNCGASCAALAYGGRYQMDNCTFANWWSGGTRTAPTFILNNYYEDIFQTIQVRQLFGCEFNNCIMFGNSAFLSDFNEFLVDIYPEGEEFQTYLFRHCLVDTNTDLSDASHYLNMINQQGPALCNPAGENFLLSVNNSNLAGLSYPTTPAADLLGYFWSGQVKKGCYQFDGDGDGLACE